MGSLSSLNVSNPTYNPPSPYTTPHNCDYTVTVTSGSCTATAIMNVSCPPLSVESIQSGGSDVFKLVPNPAFNNVDVIYQSHAGESSQLKMYDYTGKLLSAKNICCVQGENKFSLDLSNYADGIYLVTFSSASGEYKTKLVKR